MLYIICMFELLTYCNSLRFLLCYNGRAASYLFIFTRLDILIEYFYWPLKSGNIIIIVLWFYYIVIAVKKTDTCIIHTIHSHTHTIQIVYYITDPTVCPQYIYLFIISKKKVDSTLKLRFVYQQKNNKTILFAKETSQGESLIQLLMKSINPTNMFMAHNAFR